MELVPPRWNYKGLSKYRNYCCARTRYLHAPQVKLETAFPRALWYAQILFRPGFRCMLGPCPSASYECISNFQFIKIHESCAWAWTLYFQYIDISSPRCIYSTILLDCRAPWPGKVGLFDFFPSLVRWLAPSHPNVFPVESLQFIFETVVPIVQVKIRSRVKYKSSWQILDVAEYLHETKFYIVQLPDMLGTHNRLIPYHLDK